MPTGLATKRELVSRRRSSGLITCSSGNRSARSFEEKVVLSRGHLARIADKARERLRVLLSNDNPDRLSVWIERYLESVKHGQSPETIREKRARLWRGRASKA